MAAEDDAERVTGGGSEDPEARLMFTRDTSGTQGEELPLGLAGITHADVEMQLLGRASAAEPTRRPAERRAAGGRALNRSPPSRRCPC